MDTLAFPGEVARFTCRVSTYSPVAYANLPEIAGVEEAPIRLKDHIDGLGKIILRHGMSPCVGVALLHKHFNLYEDEVLVRTFENNVMTIAPDVPSDDLIPFVWAFAKTTRAAPFSCMPVEFMRVTDPTRAFCKDAKEVEQNESFLSEMFRFLSDTGTTSCLGLGLIVMKPFSARENEQLAEREQSGGQRALTVRPVPSEELAGLRATQTLWTF